MGRRHSDVAAATQFFIFIIPQSSRWGLRPRPLTEPYVRITYTALHANSPKPLDQTNDPVSYLT